jgi:hypothetical protein
MVAMSRLYGTGCACCAKPWLTRLPDTCRAICPTTYSLDAFWQWRSGAATLAAALRVVRFRLVAVATDQASKARVAARAAQSVAA